ncbi:MAG: hypothetical protein ACKVJJ_00490 [Fidelibacterota bacterium]
MNKIWLILLGLFVGFSCEENPFFGENKISERTITGIVKLDKVDQYPDGRHDGVYVWSEGLDVITTTGDDGSFELVLPMASDVSTGGIPDGDYTIHFFLGNYQISTVNLKFLSGKVVANVQVIDIDGELERIVYLDRYLGLKTTVSPNTITNSFDNNINVSIDLEPDKNDLFVNLKKIDSKDLIIYTGLLIQNFETKELAHSIDMEAASVRKELINRPSKRLGVEFNYLDVNLSKGIYEVIPYIFIDRVDIPKNLLKSLGVGYNDFNENYFKFPFKRIGGKLVVE